MRKSIFEEYAYSLVAIVQHDMRINPEAIQAFFKYTRFVFGLTHYQLVIKFRFGSAYVGLTSGLGFRLVVLGK